MKSRLLDAELKLNAKNECQGTSNETAFTVNQKKCPKKNENINQLRMSRGNFSSRGRRYGRSRRVSYGRGRSFCTTAEEKDQEV